MMKYLAKKILRRPYRYLRGNKDLALYYIKHKRTQAHAQKFHALSLQNKIVFLNFGGKGYGCNPKYIAEELIKRKFDGEIIWLVKENDPFMPKEIRQVNISGEDSFRELATARVIVNNVKGDINFKKRDGQLYIQTWHAGFSPKLLEKDAAVTLPKSYLLESKYNSEDSDLFLSNSIAQTEEYRRAFWCDCEILEMGLPRNDIFFHYNPKLKNAILMRIGINPTKKILMYAPTFRGGDDSLEQYGLDFKLLKESIHKKFGGEWVLLVRMHPNVSTSVNSDLEYIDVSKYPDMQDLLLISDILITDYSSSIFDMAEMDKIVFIYANDIEQYQSLRGLKKDFFELPFSIAEDNDNLRKNIEDFNEAEYKDAVETVKDRYCTFDKGNASDKVVDRIFEWMAKYE